MNDKGFYKLRIYPILFMVLFTLVCIALVSGIFLRTQDRVKLNESLFLRRAVLNAAGIAMPQDLAAINELYLKRVREIPPGGQEAGAISYFELLDENGILDGYALFSYGPGLWGEITAVIAFDKDKATLKGVEFIKNSETPGLGARIMEAWFKDQFRGKKGPFKLVPEGTPTGPGEMDAITGASRTSEFVRNIINNGIINAAKVGTAGEGGSNG
ncbi:MAG: FMN-binding protein [Spirochaetales bacterium]|nr:MAG: FMN-binding protein [Spirochaetales bacterium]